MYEHVDKPKENKSRVVANSVTQKKNDVNKGFGFADKRSKVNVNSNDNSRDTLPIQRKLIVGLIEKDPNWVDSLNNVKLKETTYVFGINISYLELIKKVLNSSSLNIIINEEQANNIDKIISVLGQCKSDIMTDNKITFKAYKDAGYVIEEAKKKHHVDNIPIVKSQDAYTEVILDKVLSKLQISVQDQNKTVNLKGDDITILLTYEFSSKNKIERLITGAGFNIFLRYKKVITEKDALAGGFKMEIEHVYKSPENDILDKKNKIYMSDIIEAVTTIMYAGGVDLKVKEELIKKNPIAENKLFSFDELSTLRGSSIENVKSVNIMNTLLTNHKEKFKTGEQTISAESHKDQWEEIVLALKASPLYKMLKQISSLDKALNADEILKTAEVRIDVHEKEGAFKLKAQKFVVDLSRKIDTKFN